MALLFIFKAMSKYRFKTKEELKEEDYWDDDYNCPYNWDSDGGMNHYMGKPVNDNFTSKIEEHSAGGESFLVGDWYFHSWNFKLDEPALPIEEIMKQIETNNQNSLTTKIKTKMKKAAKTRNTDKFVFMDKTVQILDIGYQTSKNIVLYGPGGHGKSEMTLEFLREKGIEPYVITMGTGMTTERLFGGMDIKQYDDTGKLEYLVENSFMNHEYVVFEEMFDAPDFILEQLKDILSSGIFRNGTQAYTIKTKFIICCTNRTRDEFSKNMSLKALMERFPLELNVIWDNYTEISYNKLLESKFGVDNVDPVIPYLLQEYAKSGITISPRIAVIAYQVYDQCGPESLSFIAEFSKKPSLIAEAIKKFEATIKFRDLSSGIQSLIGDLTSISLDTREDERVFKAKLKELNDAITDIKGLTVNDDLAAMHAQLVKAATQAKDKFDKSLKIASFI
jgi:MoxR domain in the MoxR-vWA-beta-propeller ternary systems